MIPLSARGSLVLAIFVIAATTSDAWWGSRSSSNSGGGGGGSTRWFRRTWNNVKQNTEYVKDYAGGVYDMGRAYKDMRQANWKDSDKYFHARGNYDAAQRGPGGRDAAKHISDAREYIDQNWKGDSPADSAADQEANRWGRNGGDPNKYRPAGLPEKYRKK